MSIVNKEFYEAGEILTAADLNKPYDDLVTASGQINDTNCATGFITLKHMDTSVQNCNQFYFYQNPTYTQQPYTLSTWTTISDGVTPCEVALNYAPEQYEILRVDGGGLVAEVECIDDFDYAGPPYVPGPNLGKPNYYAFRIVLNYNDGAGTLQKILGYWGYSFTSNSYEKYYTAKLNTDFAHQFQPFAFSDIEQYTGTTGVRTYEKLILQVAVFQSGINTVNISRHQLHAIRGMR